MPTNRYPQNKSCLEVIEGIAESQMKEIRRHASGEVSQQLDRVQTVFAETVEQMKRMSQLTHYLRRSTESRKIQKEPLGLSIHEVVHDVLHAMQYEHSFHHITILKILPHDLPPIHIKRDHLETILFQLIFNARGALTNQMGIVTIEAQERIYLTPENRSQYRFQIRVSDTGPEIHEEQLAHLFDPFFLGESQMAAGGFGLFIVKKLVEQNGGVIRVETAPRGTSFSIQLPG